MESYVSPFTLKEEATQENSINDPNPAELQTLTNTSPAKELKSGSPNVETNSTQRVQKLTNFIKIYNKNDVRTRQHVFDTRIPSPDQFEGKYQTYILDNGNSDQRTCSAGFPGKRNPRKFPVSFMRLNLKSQEQKKKQK